MKIPSDILKKIDEVLQKREDQKERERKAIEQRKKEDRELEDLKKTHRAESLKRAKVILGWVAEFMADVGSRKIFEIREEIYIFTANFWQGRPRPGQIYATWAVIVLNKDGRLRYEERWKGHVSSEMPLGSSSPSPEVLARKLHPEFLQQWESVIRNGKVWDYIRYSLPKHY